MVQNESHRKLKSLRIDNGGEYVSSKFKNLYGQKGIAREYTTLYTPTEDGVVDHINHTIQERVTSMLSIAHLPRDFCGEVVMIVVYIITSSPSTPLQFNI